MSVYDDVKQALQDILAPQLAELRGEYRTAIGDLRTDLETRFAKMEAHLEMRFARAEARMETGFSELRSEIAQLRAETRQEATNIHTDVVRIEQVFNARLQAFELTERIVRLEERVGRG